MPVLATADTSILLDFGVALAVGLLLGLQRERNYAQRGIAGPAGARTFPLVALLGGASWLLASPAGTPWVTAAGFLALGLLVVQAYRRAATGPAGMGMTTEVLLLLTYALGAASLAGHRETVAIVGAAALVLTAMKQRLHGFAGRLSDEDENAALKFLAVAVLVVPFLPDQDLGPYGAINPHNIGLMVILVAGVSFLGYVAVKVAGPGRGLLWTGMLGGLVSTTATTAAFARRSRETPALSKALAAGTLASCTVMFPRVLVLAAIGDASFAGHLWPHLAAMAVTTALFATLGLVALRRAGPVEVPLKNPFELAPAVWFALLFGLVILVSKAAQARFGDAGLLAAGALAGTTDVDAITLTATRLASTGSEAHALVQTVTLAVVSNSLVKSGIAFALGSRAYAVRVAAALLATAAVGGATILLL